jgi:hypothetical protein
MSKKTTAMLVAAGGLSAGAVILRRRASTDGHDGAADRWHVVTVNRSQDEVSAGGRLPGPLGEMGDAVEVQLRPAPGDRGTEVAARMRTPVPSGASGLTARGRGEDPRQDLRKALRESKSILETGEVVLPDRPSTNKPTLTGRPLDLLLGRARGEGRL